MKIALISDTHSHLPLVKLLSHGMRRLGAGYFIHCGDIGSPEVLVALAEDMGAGAFVYGNTDHDWESLVAVADTWGLKDLGHAGGLTLAGRRLFVTHGHDHPLVERHLLEGRSDYLFTGHTHRCLDATRGVCRHINPGAVKPGSPALYSSAMVIDLASGSREVVVVGGKGEVIAFPHIPLLAELG